MKTPAIKLLFFALSALLFQACNPADSGPARIAILLPPNTDTSVHDADVLDGVAWAMQEINAAGGAGGRKLQTEFHKATGDASGNNNVQQLAQSLAADKGLVAVISAVNSNQMNAIAPYFYNSNVLLVTPNATYGELYRAFKGGNIWRTVGSDIAQTKVLVDYARSKYQARKVGLISSSANTTPTSGSSTYGAKVDDVYGATFFSWFAFFAVEAGLETTTPVRYSPSQTQDCSSILECAVGLSPACQSDAESKTFADTVIVGVQNRLDAECIMKALPEVNGKLSKKVQLIVSDSVNPDTLLTEMGASAEGIAGVQPTSWSQSDYTKAYLQKFPKSPEQERYSAQAYDALLLIAYGLQASKGYSGAALNNAMKEVVMYQGSPIPWNNVSAALQSIKNNTKNQLTGAASPLRFDRVNYTDLTYSEYQPWHIEAGKVVYEDNVSASEDANADAITTSLGSATPTVGPVIPNSPLANLPEKTGNWALVVAYSFGWENYRHQADAYRQMDFLNTLGVPSDHIVFIVADDLANNPVNPNKGVVINQMNGSNNGPNLYKKGMNNYRLCTPSYSSSQVVKSGSETNVAGETCPLNVGAADILKILSGTPANGCLKEPCAIKSGPGDDVFVFFDGHGNQNGLAIGYGVAANTFLAGPQFLTPSALATTVKEMATANLYRQMLFIIEACESGTMGKYLDSSTPRTLMFTAAMPTENSLAANYDNNLGTYTANQFAFAYAGSIDQTPTETVAAMIQTVFLRVVGSHPSFYNVSNFGGAGQTRLLTFYGR